MLESFRGLRKFSGNLKYSNAGIASRQGAKHAKFGRERLVILQTIFTIFLRPLRPWRLCARYSEFRLRLSRAMLFVVNNLILGAYAD